MLHVHGHVILIILLLGKPPRGSLTVFIRGIKHDFQFINICKVPREVLKTEAEARGFQPSRGTLRMLMNDKIIFDHYYCINSANHCENEENIGTLYFITSSYNHLITTFSTFPRDVGNVNE